MNVRSGPVLLERRDREIRHKGRDLDLRRSLKECLLLIQRRNWDRAASWFETCTMASRAVGGLLHVSSVIRAAPGRRRGRGLRHAPSFSADAGTAFAAELSLPWVELSTHTCENRL
jgi:hypothetical protein